MHFVKGGVRTGKRVRKSGKNNWHFLWELTENRKIVYYKNSHIFPDWDWMQEEKSYEMSVLQQ